MGAILRVLGQAYPTANTQTTLYACGTTSAVVSTFSMANTAGNADVITARIAVGGEADNNKQLLFSNLIIAANSVLQLTAGFTFANTDILKVTSVNGTTSFQLFGQENS